MGAENADTLQRLEPVDVDQELGLRQAHVEHWHQALPASEDFSVLAMLLQQLQRLAQLGGADVTEFRRLHAPPCLLDLPFATPAGCHPAVTGASRAWPAQCQPCEPHASPREALLLAAAARRRAARRSSLNFEAAGPLPGGRHASAQIRLRRLRAGEPVFAFKLTGGGLGKPARSRAARCELSHAQGHPLYHALLSLLRNGQAAA